MALPQASTFAPPQDAAHPQDARSGIRWLAARITEALGQDRYRVAVTGAPTDAPALEAGVGVLLPELVAGDEVLLALPAQGSPAITAVLAATPSLPWQQRAIRMQSNDSITLSCGEATFKLTAQGLARVVARTIEQDARDLVDIDAAEVRIN
jgi:hypothetical protein